MSAGFDWQTIVQWTSDPIVDARGQVCPAGVTLLGANIATGNFQGVLVYLQTNVNRADIQIDHRPASAPAGSETKTVVGAAPGKPGLFTVPLFGDLITAVSAIVVGANSTVTCCVIPANTLASFTPPTVGAELVYDAGHLIPAGNTADYIIAPYAGVAVVTVEASAVGVVPTWHTIDNAAALRGGLIAPGAIGIGWSQQVRLPPRPTQLTLSNPTGAGINVNVSVLALPDPYGG